MPPKLQAVLQTHDDVTYVRLTGLIDEDSGLETLIDRIPPGMAVLDLGGIRRINSCGVRDWMDWLAALEANQVQFVLVECPPAIIAQVNMIDAFLRGGVVRTMQAPFVCPDCGDERTVTLDTRTLGDAPAAPSCECATCHVAMEFDEVAESYFAFLTGQPAQARPDRVDGVLAAVAQP